MADNQTTELHFAAAALLTRWDERTMLHHYLSPRSPLRKRGLVELKDGEFRLTEEGRKMKDKLTNG